MSLYYLAEVNHGIAGAEPVEPVNNGIAIAIAEVNNGIPVLLHIPG
jgi:hypothetical protein